MKHLKVLPLHKQKEYTSECVALLNSEWPRSETARLRSLQTSCDCLPTSLIMIFSPINNNENTIAEVTDSYFSTEKEDRTMYDKEISCDIVVGHSKISKLCSIHDACFIESVVIHKDYRGKGWGKYLMEQSELFVKSLGINLVYLTTLDKQGFYSRIGYTETEPVPIFGGIPTNINERFNLLSINSKRSDFSSSTPKNVKASTKDFTVDEVLASSVNTVNVKAIDKAQPETQLSVSGCVKDQTYNMPSFTPSPPAPPPPPMPKNFPIFNGKSKFYKNTNTCSGNKTPNESKKTFMMKFL